MATFPPTLRHTNLHTPLPKRHAPPQNIVSNRRPTRRRVLGHVPSPSGRPIGTWNVADMTSKCAGQVCLVMATPTSTPSTNPLMATTTHSGERQLIVNAIKTDARFRGSSYTHAEPLPRHCNLQSTTHLQGLTLNVSVRLTPLNPSLATAATPFAPPTMSSWTAHSSRNPV